MCVKRVIKNGRFKDGKIDFEEWLVREGSMGRRFL